MKHGRREATNRNDGARQTFDGDDKAPRDGKQPYATETEDYGGEKIIAPQGKNEAKTERSRQAKR